MMANGARFAGWAVGGTLFVAGLMLHAVGGNGWGVMIAGLAVIGSVLLERRYRNRALAEHRLGDRWSLTAERFIDSESGVPMQVWVDPLTGERRYVPVPGSITNRT